MASNAWLKALALWCGILVLAVLNGILREKALVPVMGLSAALVASGILLSACIFAAAVVATPWYGRLRSPQWLLIGVLWLVLTVAFEFGFGRFVQHKSWPELLVAYTFEGGNLWLVVLVATFLSPWLAAKLRYG